MLEKNHSVRTKIADYTWICICAMLLGLAYILFITPNNFAPAGFHGIAAMIEYKSGFSIGYFSLIMNVPLCTFAFFYVNREFGIKSMVFCVVYSVSYLIFQNIDALNAIIYNAGDHDTIFPCLVAGMLSGFVYGTCFRKNASTGGTDIIAKSISKKRPHLNFFWINFVINAGVALASLFVYGTENGTFSLDYKPVCLCVAYCFVSNFIGNYILRGHKTAYQFIIITPHSEDIEREILARLHHSATRIRGKGIYSESDREVLMCVVNKHQIVEFEKILKNYNDTFAYVETVNETYGNFRRGKKMPTSPELPENAVAVLEAVNATASKED